MGVNKVSENELLQRLRAKTREIEIAVAQDQGLDYASLEGAAESRLIEFVEKLIETFDEEAAHPDRGAIGVLLAERNEIERQLLDLRDDVSVWQTRRRNIPYKRR